MPNLIFELTPSAVQIIGIKDIRFNMGKVQIELSDGTVYTSPDLRPAAIRRAYFDEHNYTFTVEYTDDTSYTTPPLIKVIEGKKGDKGDPGAPGVQGEPGAIGASIHSVTRFYLYAALKPEQPLTLHPNHNWSTTEPILEPTSNAVVWFVDRFLYSDDTFTYSIVQKSNVAELAKDAHAKASEANSNSEAANNKAIAAKTAAQEAATIAENAKDEAEAASGVAAVASRAARTAKVIAEDTKQHFWADGDGAHLTEQEHVEGSPVTGANALISSRGFEMRNGSDVLSSITSDALQLFDAAGRKISRTGKKPVRSGSSLIGYQTDRVLPLSYIKDAEGTLLQQEWIPCTKPVPGQPIQAWITIIPMDWASEIRYVQLQPRDYELRPTDYGDNVIFVLRPATISRLAITEAHSCTVHLSYISGVPQDAFVMYNREQGYPVMVKSQELDEAYIYRGMAQLSSMWCTYINADTIHAKKIEGWYEESHVTAGGVIWTVRKYADGTATAEGSWSGALSAVNAWGAIYYSVGSQTDLPPGLFISPPLVNIDVETSNGELWITRKPSTKDYIGGVFYLSASKVQRVDARLIYKASGRWKA